MTKRIVFSSAISLLAIFLLCRCSHESAIQNSRDKDIFQVDTRTAKIFFYASYNNPDDKPFFTETFRLRIDGSYIGDINPDQYLAFRVTPGQHVIDVDEIDWGGNTANHTNIKAWVNNNESYYVTEHLGADPKPTLSKTDNGLGATDIAARKLR